MYYKLSKYLKNPFDISEEEKNILKKIIFYVIFSEKTNLYLDFSGILLINEDDFKEILEDLLDNNNALSRIKVRFANNSVKRSLIRIINCFNSLY